MFRLAAFIFLASATCFSGLVSTRAQEVVFEDRFEGALKPGWVWLRENTGCRRFIGDSLEIKSEPFQNEEARNVLARPLNFFRWLNGRSEYSYRIETECSFLQKPTAQFQQCGVYWLRGNRIVFKLVFVNVDGRICVYPGRVPLDPDIQGGRLRITVRDRNMVAEFCGENGTEFKRVYEGRIDALPNDQISLQCWNGSGSRTGAGSSEDNGEAWARFQYFRVERIDE